MWSTFLDRLCLALRASGLWLRYAALQNLIPSFPWIAPHALHPGAIQGKEGIKFCHLATLWRNHPLKVECLKFSCSASFDPRDLRLQSVETCNDRRSRRRRRRLRWARAGLPRAVGMAWRRGLLFRPGWTRVGERTDGQPPMTNVA